MSDHHTGAGGSSIGSNPNQNSNNRVAPFPADLNTFSSPNSDLTAQDLDGWTAEDDLAMFTNTNFVNFDHVDPALDDHHMSMTSLDGQGGQSEYLSDDFQFPDFPGFQTLLTDPNSVAVAPVDVDLTPIQTSVVPTIAYRSSGSSSLVSPSTMPSYVTPTSKAMAGITSPRAGDKRKMGQVVVDEHHHHHHHHQRSQSGDNTSSLSPVVETPSSDHSVTSPLEEASRLAAEEDKRRRNTAASARFRVKKKQREQTLERTAKEMTDKVGSLEARIGQLETENKWLKNLITEKNENKDELSTLWRKKKHQLGGSGAGAGDDSGHGVGVVNITTEPVKSET